VVPLCWAPYLIYAAATGDFRWLALAKLAGITALLVLLYVPWPVRNSARFAWQDAGAAIVLIAVVLSGWLRGIWNVPVNLDFMNRLFLIAAAGWTWTVVRPVPELGYELRISRKVLLEAGRSFVLFAVIAIPLSLALHFTRWNPKWRGAGAFALDFLEILLFVALLEEMFFRGFLQSLLTASFGDWRWAQATVACVFGLFHILHAPFPNWRYVVLAAIAGWFYGEAYRRTGNLTASALVHAAVDATWRTWLAAR